MKIQNALSVSIVATVACLATGCEAPRSGHYFGGLVHVDLEGDGPRKNVYRTPPSASSADVNRTKINLDAIAWPEFYNQAAKRRRTNPDDRSAGTVAVGDCWVGCNSLDPYPMDHFEIALNVDVDTAYRRVKSDFGYSTLEEYSGGRVVLEARLKKSLDFSGISPYLVWNTSCAVTFSMTHPMKIC